jgi:hypothetical protein
LRKGGKKIAPHTTDIATPNSDVAVMKGVREYGTNGNNGTDGISLGFRLFRYFRLFRILSSTWHGKTF